MTDKAIGPLRQRMIEDMTIRKLAPKTQHDYVQRVKNFATLLGRSPDTATFEDVRRYQLHLQSAVSSPSIVREKCKRPVTVGPSPTIISQRTFASAAVLRAAMSDVDPATSATSSSGLRGSHESISNLQPLIVRSC
jgi:hypothetical protein